MKITIEVPEEITEEEIKKLIEKYIKKKKKYEEYYKLIEDVDWNELEGEVRKFRESFRLREFNH